jgi:glycosyltransferase involved in cell wall biosynthesis
MKLCFVSAYPPSKGNLAEYGQYLVNELLKHDSIEEIVVLADYNPNSCKTERFGKLKIVRCWRRDSFLIPIDIVKTLRKEAPEIVHFNLHMMSWGKKRVSNFLGAITPYIVKKFLRKKVTITLHNITEATNLKELGIKPSKLDFLGSYLATKSLLSVDKVVVTLRSFIHLLNKKYGKNNIVHIPHGTLGKRVKNVKAGGKTILTLGFWRDGKKLPLLIEVFKELQKKDKKLKLIVAGTSHPNFPGYIEKIKKKYENVKNLFFTGYVPEEDLDKIFLSSTLVVLPYSTATGSSGIIHLAASYGKPVIVTDLPEMREIMKEYVTIK